MAFYFVNDGIVDVAVSFDDGQTVATYALSKASQYAVFNHYVSGSRPNVLSGVELLQPYSQYGIEHESIRAYALRLNAYQVEFPFWLDESGGGGYTLTCETGAYALTGQSATLTKSKNIIANTGGYAYAGQSATLTKSKLLIATNGAYIYAGNSAVLTYTAGTAAYTLTALTGNYALIGNSATLTKSKLVTANAGAYTYTGVAANLKKSKLLSSNAGSYALTGNNATLTKASTGAYSLTCLSGSYSFNGNNANLVWKANGGAADYPAKKYIVRKNGQLLVFKNKLDALNVINDIEDATSELNILIDIDVAEKQIDAPSVAKIAPLPAFKPVYDIDAMLQRLQSNLQAEQLLQARQYQALLALYEQFIDDEEVELLLMAA